MTAQVGRSAKRQDGETWKPVTGYEGLYAVSDKGRIKSERKGRCLTPVLDGHGYQTVCLCGTRFFIHRLVALAFHPEKRNALHRQVAHLDGSRTNNQAHNLKWVSNAENQSHKRLHGTHQAGEKHPRVKLTAANVAEIRRSNESNCSLGRAFGVNESAIRKIRAGQRWQGEHAVGSEADDAPTPSRSNQSMVELTLKQNVIELLNKHIDRCRKAVSECPKWSPAQAEWSRARDALLNFGDDLARIDTPPSSSTEICPDCNGAGGDNQYWRCARCNGSGGIPPSSTPEVVEAVARAIAHARSWQTTALTVGDWDCRSKNEKLPFIEMARAAIAALPPSNSLEDGRVGKPTGLSQAEPVSRLGPSGFDPSRVEFRPDSKGKFDELVARFADGLVFFEDLGENGLFVDLVWSDRRGVRLWAAAKRGCLTYSHEDDLTDASAIEARQGGDATEIAAPSSDESAVPEGQTPDSGIASRGEKL